MLQNVIMADCAPPMESAIASDPAQVRATIEQILAGHFVGRKRLERRRDARVPFPYLIRLTADAGSDDLSRGECITVVGRYVSSGGVDFYHREPIEHRKAVIWLEAPGIQRVKLLMELSWCRFNRYGWYDSGGRFLKVLAQGAQ